MRSSPHSLMNCSRSILNTPSDNTNQQTFVYFATLTEGINLFFNQSYLMEKHLPDGKEILRYGM